MTREEALGLYHNIRYNATGNRHKEAVDIAFEALRELTGKKDCYNCKNNVPDDDEYSPCFGCIVKGDGSPSEWEASENYKPMSNADRIRAMSDEELAAMLAAFCEASECRTACGAVCPFYDKCPHDGLAGLGRAWEVWLQQPAEEDA